MFAGLPRFAGLVVLLGLVGCATGTSEVDGVVRYQGKPLSAGSITFQGADGKEAHSAIGSNGRYVIRGVARGTARIRIVSHAASPYAKGATKHEEIPARYGSVESSGVSVEVKGGKLTHDVDLTP